MKGIPILVYHKVDSRLEPGVTTVHPGRFRRHVQFLQDHGFRSVTFRDILENRPLPARPVILSFDDGLESVYREAFPVLQALGFRAVVCMVAGFVGRTNGWDVNLGGRSFRHLDWAQLKELHSQGWEIASHSLTHRALPFLNHRALERELRESRRVLENGLRDQVVTLAYPFGLYNRRVLRAARRAGYRFGLGNVFWDVSAPDAFALPRLTVFPFDAPRQLSCKLNGRPGLPLRLSLAMLRWPAVLTPIYQLLFRRHLFLDK